MRFLRTIWSREVIWWLLRLRFSIRNIKTIKRLLKGLHSLMVRLRFLSEFSTNAKFITNLYMIFSSTSYGPNFESKIWWSSHQLRMWFWIMGLVKVVKGPWRVWNIFEVLGIDFNSHLDWVLKSYLVPRREFLIFLWFHSRCLVLTSALIDSLSV